MNKIKFIASCLVMMFFSGAFVSCDEMEELLNGEQFYDFEVVSCERIGSKLRIDFSLTNKTGQVQNNVLLDGCYSRPSSDNLGAQYGMDVAIDGGAWSYYKTISMSKGETISGSFLVHNYDQTNTSKSFNLVFQMDWDSWTGDYYEVKEDRIPVVDNRVLENGFQTNDNGLEYRHIKSFINGETAYITFSIKNNTGRALSGLLIQPTKLVDNTAQQYYSLEMTGSDNYSSSSWRNYLEDITLSAGETMTFTMRSQYIDNPNAKKFSGELRVEVDNYNVTDDIVRFYTLPVSAQ